MRNISYLDEQQKCIYFLSITGIYIKTFRFCKTHASNCFVLYVVSLKFKV